MNLDSDNPGDEANGGKNRLVKAVWDSLPDATVYRLIHYPDGRTRFDWASAGFEGLFELPERVILKDAAPLYGLLHPLDRDEAISAQQHAAVNLAPFRHECRFNLPSGKTRWIRWHSMPEPLSEGRIAWNGVALDVTARRQAEEALRELNATLEQRVAERTAESQQRSRQLAELAGQLTRVEQQERRRLADYLHDDLQQLLVVARLQAQTLAASTPQPHCASLSKLHATLTQAIEAARNISRQIAPPVAVHGHLPEAVQWIVREVRQSHNLVVEARFRGELRDVPEAESILLFTAARELLLNVVKHAGILEAGLDLAREDDAVVLEVRDAGCGTSPARLAAPDTPGFGLFSIRERSESMGGSTTLDSSPGRGTRVSVRLPLAAVPAILPPARRQKPEAAETRESPQTNAAGAGRIRVLFADDHQLVRESLANLLKAKGGIDVVGQCADGQQAVEQAGRLRPDLVIMDYNMPVMDGVEATRRIKDLWPGIKVIGLSMFDDAEGGVRMRAAGADGYVSKSGPPDKLIEAIQKYAAGAADDTVDAQK